MSSSPHRRIIISADDFGMSEEVNEAIEQAHREGILSTTSLMVAAPAAKDALRRARRLPSLRVGLHLVVIEGDSVLQHPAITNHAGWFERDQLKLGMQYFFSLKARTALRREIEAQFRAFSHSGLVLDHANAHKHMHLHPTVGRLLLETGQNYGLKAVRTPMEPAAPLGEATRWNDHMLARWTSVLRRQIRQAGMKTNDYCFGIRWSGQMNAEKVQRLLPRLPSGVSELYFHPATAQNAQMAALMPGYRQEEEFAALTSPAVKEIMTRHNLHSIGWADL